MAFEYLHPYPSPEAAAAFAFVPLRVERRSDTDMLAAGRGFFEKMDGRRSVRSLSDEPVPRELIDIAIATASTAPSGAHLQPWTFVVVGDQEVKRSVRLAAEDEESCGIAAGLFIAALHHMGLVTLTHTPTPMAFLSKILDRPSNQRPFVLFPVGHPSPDAQVPDLHRKSLDEVMVTVGR